MNLKYCALNYYNLTLEGDHGFVNTNTSIWFVGLHELCSDKINNWLNLLEPAESWLSPLWQCGIVHHMEISGYFLEPSSANPTCYRTVVEKV